MDGRWEAYLEWIPAPGRARRSTCRGLRPGAPDREDLLSALHECQAAILQRLARLTSDLNGDMETVREHVAL